MAAPSPGGPSVLEVIGTLADSVAGLGAIGALILGFVVFKRQQDDQRQSQASQVAVETLRLEPSGNGDDRFVLAAEVVNFSPLGIFLAECRSWVLNEPGTYLAPVSSAGLKFFGRLNPGASRVIEYEITLLSDPSITACMFKDANGVHWSRFEDGALLRGGSRLEIIRLNEQYVRKWRRPFETQNAEEEREDRRIERMFWRKSKWEQFRVQALGRPPRTEEEIFS